MQLPWQHSPRKSDGVGNRLVAPLWPPMATLCLLAAQGLVCLAQLGLRRAHAGADPLLSAGALSAGGLRAWHLWQPVTALFLTGLGAAAWLLPASGLVLGLAGRPLEAVIGRRHLFQLFFLAGIGGGLSQAGIDRYLDRDIPLAGSTASVAGVLWALACIMPRASLLPGALGLGRIKVMHAALGAGAVAVAGAEQPLGAGVLIGCLTGCVYMRCLGFGQRLERTRTPDFPSANVLAPAASGWSQATSQSPPSAQPVLTAPSTTATADPALLQPRFSDHERRMTAREYISERIDPILDKISLHGINSLTDDDRRVLAKGREKLGPPKL